MPALQRLLVKRNLRFFILSCFSFVAFWYVLSFSLRGKQITENEGKEFIDAQPAEESVSETSTVRYKYVLGNYYAFCYIRKIRPRSYFSNSLVRTSAKTLIFSRVSEEIT